MGLCEEGASGGQFGQIEYEMLNIQGNATQAVEHMSLEHRGGWRHDFRHPWHQEVFE